MVEKKDDGKATVEKSIEAVQAVVDEANSKGYFGEAVDETPRENYTVAGVTSGAQVPDERRK